MKRFPLLILLFLCSLPALGQDDYVRLRAVNYQDRYLNVESGKLDIGLVGPGFVSARWQIVEVGKSKKGPLYTVKNLWTGQYLTVLDDDVTMGPLMLDNQGFGASAWLIRRDIKGGTATLEFSSPSSPVLWMINRGGRFVEEMPPEAQAVVPYTRILPVNDTGFRLNTESGKPEASPAEDGFWSAMWEVESNHDDQGRLVAFKNRYTGEYLSANGEALTMGKVSFNRTGSPSAGVWRVVPSPSNGDAVMLINTATKSYLIWSADRTTPANQQLFLVPKPTKTSLWLLEDVQQ